MVAYPVRVGHGSTAWLWACQWWGCTTMGIPFTGPSDLMPDPVELLVCPQCSSMGVHTVHIVWLRVCWR